MHWHIESLGRYIREAVNPIGLSIQIFPILDNISKELKNNWEMKLNDCSMNLMLLLQNEYRQQLEGMDVEISTLYAWLSPLKKHEEYAAHEKKLKEHLEIFGKAILIKKEKKYWRDKNAFGEGRASKWNIDKKNSKRKIQELHIRIVSIKPITICLTHPPTLLLIHKSAPGQKKGTLSKTTGNGRRANKSTKNELRTRNQWSHHGWKRKQN